ncbi:MAG TPA: FAD-dependent oxidoreductase, partial [Polyangiaceae bacterium]|nr:FAD-dependent oxidoreductase [Polyangiaceae bacterium]
EYLPLLPRLGSPLGAILERSGLARFEPLRVYLDALCQITLQCSAAEGEAVFAFCAMDYYHRGAGHVRGGIGALAELLLTACTRNGVDVRLATRVKGIEPVPPEAGRFKVQTRRGDVYADHVIANVLPSQLASWLGPSSASPTSLQQLSKRVEAGYGAAMLYGLLGGEPSNAATPFHTSSPPVRHRQLVLDVERPFVEGNHVFVSLGELQPGLAESDDARRSLTMSTHLPLPTLQARGDAAPSYVAEVQARMRATFERLCPDWALRLQHSFTASPRTFARFVGRSRGAVGGIPRRAGLDNYRQLGPYRVRPGLWLVGDSVFPGQSALAAAVGGIRTAAAVARCAGIPRSADVLGGQVDSTASLPPA